MKHEEISNAFDRQAEAVYCCRVFSDKEKIWKILRFADIKADYRVVDIGCGPGYILRESEFVHEVTGLDISEEMIRIAKSQAPYAKIVRGVAEELPFVKGYFDIVISRAMLHHVTDVPSALKEMARICKPGGYVIVAETLSSSERSQADLHNYVEKLRDPSHNRMLSNEEYHSLIAGAGLQLVDELRTKDVRELEEWTAVTSPPESAKEEIRRLLTESIGEDRLGLRPIRKDGAIYFTHIGTTFKATRG